VNSNPDENNPERGVFYLSSESAVRYIQDGAVVIDVRTDQEYSEGHLPNAQLIPHTELQCSLDRLASLWNKEIILYCRSGVRSNWSAAFLRSKGFEKAFNGGKYVELLEELNRPLK
jgi:phage shock protein E